MIWVSVSFSFARNFLMVLLFCSCFLESFSPDIDHNQLMYTLDQNKHGRTWWYNKHSSLLWEKLYKILTNMNRFSNHRGLHIPHENLYPQNGLTQNQPQWAKVCTTWPLVWKTYKCHGFWQMSGKYQGFFLLKVRKVSGKNPVRVKWTKIVYC